MRDIWLKARRSVPRTCLWSMCNSSTLATVSLPGAIASLRRQPISPAFNDSSPRRIAASLRVSMREAEKQEVLGRAPRDLGVYELTLRGAGKHRFNAEATRAAREDLEEAIRLDPHYAPAWTQLAWINLTDLWTQLTGEWHLSQIDEVVDQFRRAIELDPNLAKAYSGLGQAMKTKGDLVQALESVKACGRARAE